MEDLKGLRELVSVWILRERESESKYNLIPETYNSFFVGSCPYWSLNRIMCVLFFFFTEFSSPKHLSLLSLLFLAQTHFLSFSLILMKFPFVLFYLEDEDPFKKFGYLGSIFFEWKRSEVFVESLIEVDWMKY